MWKKYAAGGRRWVWRPVIWPESSNCVRVCRTTRSDIKRSIIQRRSSSVLQQTCGLEVSHDCRSRPTQTREARKAVLRGLNCARFVQNIGKHSDSRIYKDIHSQHALDAARLVVSFTSGSSLYEK
jgi:hypothetical protein